MGLISPAQVSDGTTADASDVNSPINTIANEFNGNIDNANIKSAAAIDGSKIASNSVDIGAKASIWDGWVAVSDSWTYASATTVTVPSDATTKFSVGDKIKFSNGSTKYFTIQAVTATLITFTGGSATVANSAITSIYYSKVLTPQSFPGIANPYKFNVYRNAAWSTSAGSFAKVTFDTEVFDTNNNFDSTTNYRYTAPIAGFYQFNASCGVLTNPGSFLIISLYKNGAEVTRGNQINCNAAAGVTMNSMLQVSANDYFEIFVYGTNVVAADVGNVAARPAFSGFLVSQT